MRESLHSLLAALQIPPERIAAKGLALQAQAQRVVVAEVGESGFVLSDPAGNRHGYAYEPWHWCHKLPG